MSKQSESRSKAKTVGTDGTVFRCPMCKTPLANADVPTFPFCSDRCRLIDLKNWVDGKYTMARPIDPTDQLEEMPGGPEQGPG
jgi:uncharacterized protein